MGIVWEIYTNSTGFFSMAIVWDLYGAVREMYGKCLGTVWDLYENCMGIV